MCCNDLETDIGLHNEVWSKEKPEAMKSLLYLRMSLGKSLPFQD